MEQNAEWSRVVMRWLIAVLAGWACYAQGYVSGGERQEQEVRRRAATPQELPGLQRRSAAAQFPVAYPFAEELR